ncbi:hypothetical protein OBV_15160 [Oscillibacter valericigenes Sjm18-20]|nr:hypothetical protein OBV_15160 [Oscillibacter valericigenes Sjm18-20]
MKASAIVKNEGIQNKLTIKAFDVFARNMQDKGLNGVDTGRIWPRTIWHSSGASHEGKQKIEERGIGVLTAF